MNIKLERGGLVKYDERQRPFLLEWKIEENVDGTYVSTDGSTLVTVEMNPPENSHPRIIALTSDRFKRRKLRVFGSEGEPVLVDKWGSERRLVSLKRVGRPKADTGATHISINERLIVKL